MKPVGPPVARCARHQASATAGRLPVERLFRRAAPTGVVPAPHCLWPGRKFRPPDVARQARCRRRSRRPTRDRREPEKQPCLHPNIRPKVLTSSPSSPFLPSSGSRSTVCESHARYARFRHRISVVCKIADRRMHTPKEQRVLRSLSPCPCAGRRAAARATTSSIRRAPDRVARAARCARSPSGRRHRSWPGSPCP